MVDVSTAEASVLFLALGRRGAIARLAHETVKALPGLPSVRGAVVVSRHSEAFTPALAASPHVIPVDVFRHGLGAIFGAWRLPALRARLRAEIRARNAGVVIDLMPHVWSPALIGAIHDAGARYVAIAHDGQTHPGDRTGHANRWAERALDAADGVIALSDAVADRLRTGGRIAPERIKTLFHPDFTYTQRRQRRRAAGQPLRLLFLGRILPYKGLPLLIEALSELNARQVPVKLSVLGEGPLGLMAQRLADLGAEVVNRWQSDAEIAAALENHDVMVLTHTEGSQSGLIAAAYGAGLPVITTPVGGLVEQVTHGQTGLIAQAVTAEAIAQSIQVLASDDDLYNRLAEGVACADGARSMSRFIEAAVRAATAELTRGTPF